MEWTRITPETYPPEMEPIIIAIRRWGTGERTVYDGVARWNKKMGRIEVLLNDGRKSRWVGEVFWEVTHWMRWPAPPLVDLG